MDRAGFKVLSRLPKARRSSCQVIVGLWSGAGAFNISTHVVPNNSKKGLAARSRQCLGLAQVTVSGSQAENVCLQLAPWPGSCLGLTQTHQLSNVVCSLTRK